MLPSSLDWLPEELDRLERDQLRRRLSERESAQGSEVVIDGRRLVNFGANDYLGLAADSRLAEAAIASIQGTGWGSGASPLVSGRSTVHAQLETKLAQFEETEAALLFPSGFAANAGTIPALVGEGDAIYADANNHASLIDGARLSKAVRVIYPHGDWRALADLLAKDGNYRRRLIVTDSLFSMDGDLAPLVEIAQLATEYSAMLIVDEAHATGVWGARGRGVVEYLAERAPDLEQQVTLRVGTLSKALGASGGFVCGSQMLIDWLVNNARTYIYSTAAESVSAAAGIEALKIVEQEPERRTSLLERSRQLRDALTAREWDLAGSQSQIVPIVIGSAERTMDTAARIREAGLFVPGIRPPTVAPGRSRLRVSLSYVHSPEVIERLVEAIGVR
ncbi:MAG: 8-amino-7-oxononanoate synthase [Aeoliella sp.]